MIKAIPRFAAVLFFLLILPQVNAETITGKVVGVLDGDTVEVLDATNTPHRIRLAGIDAPEKAQPFGNRAKKRLLELVGGQTVEVESNKVDQYGRTVGKLICDGQDANLAMVKSGLAWWYREYAREQSEADRGLYEAAETAAKAERLGLWSDPNPIPPWDWRHQPAPAEGYAATCPCGSGTICTGPKGGRFCIAADGQKHYRPRREETEVEGQ